MDWITHGACRDNPTEYWFPPLERASHTWPGTKIAKEICSECPVWEECREYAYHNEPHGTWAGETAEERVVRRLQNGLKILPGGKFGKKIGKKKSGRSRPSS